MTSGRWTALSGLWFQRTSTDCSYEVMRRRRRRKWNLQKLKGTERKNKRYKSRSIQECLAGYQAAQEICQTLRKNIKDEVEEI